MRKKGGWVETWATLALVVWVMVAGYWLVVGPLFWVCRWWGPFDWGQVNA